MDIDRRALIGGVALSASFLAACQKSANSAREAELPQSPAVSDDEITGPLRAYVEQHRAAWGLPGMTVALVTRDGYEAVLTSGHADLEQDIPVRPDHLFQVGSISKMFTALAAWSLIDDGLLSPDANLLDSLEGLQVRGGEDIHLQHLLNHTSGLPSDSALFPEGGLWTGFRPGTEWSYSNCGYRLAGKIIAAADGRLFPEVVQARVLEKIGMSDSTAALRVADRSRYAQGYEPALTDRLNPLPPRMSPAPWVDSDSAAGNIAATPGDMVKFLRFMIDLADGKGGPVFSDDAAKRFLANPVEGWGPGSKYRNGVAWVEAGGRTYLHHTGGMISFCSSLHIDPEAGVAAFASSNVHYSLNYRPRSVTVHACDLMRAMQDGTAPPSPPPPHAELELPEQYAGDFTAANGDRFTVAVAGPDIRLRKNGRDSALYRATDRLFSTDDPDHAVTGLVIESEDGKAVRAWCGDVEYLADPAIGYKPPAPESLRVLAGRYDNDDRWAGPIYVYARDGKLLLGNIVELVKGEGDFWRTKDTTSPEQIRFDGRINGAPQRMLFSGIPYIRRFS
jgi:CubicO group peptidase (beta-lactamase class C family)